MGSVAAPARHLDVEAVAGRHGRPAPHVDGAGLVLRREVQAVDLVDARALQHAGLDHRLRAGEHFLRRLEDEDRRAWQLLAPRREDLGGGDRDRGVAVVPASVHDARRARGERRPESLCERQRVDVGAPRDRLARCVAAQDPDDARLRDAGLHLEPGGGETLRDDVRRALLRERQLGMAMEVAPQRHHALEALRDLIAPGPLRLAHCLNASAKRPGANASSEILGVSPRMRSAMARPMAGPNRMPLRAPPAATYAPSIPGTRPSTSSPPDAPARTQAVWWALWPTGIASNLFT